MSAKKLQRFVPSFPFRAFGNTPLLIVPSRYLQNEEAYGSQQEGQPVVVRSWTPLDLGFFGRFSIRELLFHYCKISFWKLLRAGSYKSARYTSAMSLSTTARAMGPRISLAFFLLLSRCRARRRFAPTESECRCLAQLCKQDLKLRKIGSANEETLLPHIIESSRVNLVFDLTFSAFLQLPPSSPSAD
jgi:hypothetical protein